MSKKKKEQEPVPVSAPYSFVSAMNALYVANKIALERKDHTALIDIANSYIEMGTQLLVAGVELVYDEEGLAEEPEQPIIGFTGGSVDREKEVESPNEPTEDRGGVGF